MQEYNVQELISQGYRRVSNRFCLISRIDRQDWKEYMASTHAPWDPEGDGMAWVNCLGNQPGSAEDWYRRCLSKDVITVSKGISSQIPSSGHDSIEYVKLNK